MFFSPGFLSGKPRVPVLVEQFLTTPGYGTWVVPSGCTSVTIECIGAGGGGVPSGQFGRGGGGGGEYRIKSNYSVTPGASISYFIGSGIIADNGQFTYFGSSNPATAPCLAYGGTRNTNEAGGAGGTGGTGDFGYAGGKGGNGVSSASHGGGGGAGGPNGAGNAGGNGNYTGGSGDAGFGGAGGNPAGNGGNGTEWGSYGSGGGGGTRVTNGFGGAGGLYGGGGGASVYSLGTKGGDGLIRLRYYI